MSENEKEAIDYLNRKINSLSERIIQLEAENKRLHAAMQILMAEKEQWFKSKILMETVVHQNLTSTNENVAMLSEELQRLKDENRKLRGE